MSVEDVKKKLKSYRRNLRRTNMIKKLEKELKELNVKRSKLSKFLAKQNKKTLSATQLELLKEQKQAMGKYAKALKLRIKDLKEAK